MRLISDLGEIGIDSGAKLAKARDAYDALSETSRAKVTNLSALEAAEARYRALIDASGEAARRWPCRFALLLQEQVLAWSDNGRTGM